MQTAGSRAVELLIGSTFQHEHVNPSDGQLGRERQAGGAGANDDDVGIHCRCVR